MAVTVYKTKDQLLISIVAVNLLTPSTVFSGSHHKFVIHNPLGRPIEQSRRGCEEKRSDSGDLKEREILEENTYDAGKWVYPLSKSCNLLEDPSWQHV